MDAVIIEAALNGVTTKASNPHVPRAPEEVTRDALACFALGAAIIHSHADLMAVDADVAAERYLEAYRPIVAERPDALLYPTTNAGPGVERAFAHFPLIAAEINLRVGIVDPGSVNLGSAGDDGVPNAPGFVYANSFGDIHHQVELCRRERLGPSMAIFEPGFLRTALAWSRAGRLPAGAMVKLYFGGEHGYLGGTGRGATFGLPPTPKGLAAYLELLEGSGLPWSVAVLGGDVVASGIARAALEAGGHIHVGLEDYGGPDQPTNEELVTQAVKLCDEVGRPVATCAQAADLVGLP